MGASATRWLALAPDFNRLGVGPQEIRGAGRKRHPRVASRCRGARDAADAEVVTVRFRLAGTSFLALDREQFDLADQRVSGADVPSAAIPEGQIGGDEELPLRSHRHHLQRF